MARVVQQQKSNPPYLLILFVFLFLVATVVAVLMYLDSDKAKKDVDRLTKTNTALVGGAGEPPPAVQAMIAKYDQDRTQTVLVQMQQKINQLTEFVTGTADATNAVPLAEDVYARLGTRPGLANQVLDEMGKVSAKEKEIQRLNAVIATKKAELDQDANEIKVLGADREKERSEANTKIAELDAKLDAMQKERDKAVADLTQDRNNQIASRDKTIAEQNDKIVKLTKRIHDLEIELAGVEQKHPSIRPDESGPQPNGKIVRVGGADTVYVSLGQNERVRPYMSFGVYPASGIPNDANNSKAKIVVTSVLSGTSQCRVVMLRDKNNPILPDDLIYNLFFERARTLKFVVVGLFDIYGASVPSAQGAEEVKLLIQRYGGTIENEVSTDTDYVVIGEELAAPKAAPEGATAAPASPEVEKARAEFEKARKDAAQYKIPVLNVNRFLSLIGFDPSVMTGSK